MSSVLLAVFQNGRNDKAQEFFLKQASELQNQAEWKDWFVLPFLPAPDSNPTFATYFSRQWADTFIVSLHNFLSVLFQCMHILFLPLIVKSSLPWCYTLNSHAKDIVLWNFQLFFFPGDFLQPRLNRKLVFTRGCWNSYCSVIWWCVVPQAK